MIWRSPCISCETEPSRIVLCTLSRRLQLFAARTYLKQLVDTLFTALKTSFDITGNGTTSRKICLRTACKHQVTKLTVFNNLNRAVALCYPTYKVSPKKTGISIDEMRIVCIDLICGFEWALWVTKTGCEPCRPKAAWIDPSRRDDEAPVVAASTASSPKQWIACLRRLDVDERSPLSRYRRTLPFVRHLRAPHLKRWYLRPLS